MTTTSRRHPRRYYVRWLLDLYRGHGAMLALLLGLTALSTLASVLLPQVLRHVLDRVIADLGALRAGQIGLGEVMEARNRNVLLLLAVGSFWLVGPIYPWLRLQMNLFFERILRERFTRAVLGRDPGFFLGFRTGDVVTRLTANLKNAPSGLPWLCCSGIFRALTAIMVIGCCVIGMFTLHPWLALAGVIPLPVMLALFMHLQSTVEGRAEAVQERTSTTTAFLESVFSGIRIVKALTAEAPQRAAYRELLALRRVDELAQARIEGLLQVYFEFLTYLGEVLVLVCGGVLVVQGSLTIGAYYAFFSYLGMILWSVMDVPMLLITLSQAFVVIDRLEELAGTAPTSGVGQVAAAQTAAVETGPVSTNGAGMVMSGPETAAVSHPGTGAGVTVATTLDTATEPDAGAGFDDALTGAGALAVIDRVVSEYDVLRFDQVGFTYPLVAPEGGAAQTATPLGNAAAAVLAAPSPKARPFSLRGVSFTVRRGEKVAVMGPIGSGKSTLLALAAGLVEPGTGTVSIDGRPMAEVDRRAWRDRVGFVQQEPVVFSATVRENIDFWRGLDDAQVTTAADLAQIRDEIERLPHKFDERLGARGTGLSGGQRQRLALARALAGAPQLLLMDDVTAGLDAANERRLWRRLRASAPDTTCLIVTHRAATARVADRIVVIDRGRVAAVGRHDELVRTSVLYRDLIGLRSLPQAA